ncbi:MAG: pyridoxal 5'-phosphate synthase glutaminase subunit PdxT [Candidatus Limnocylindria bacterium]
MTRAMAHRDPSTPARVGVLALQGAVREHAEAIRDAGCEPVEVRLPEDLRDVDALILPGGESTAIRKLIDHAGLREPILDAAREGRPMLGTCAGMILLASEIADGDEWVFGLLDITVRRNAFGRQIASFETDLDVPSLGDAPMHAVFIRAPVVEHARPGVEVLARDERGRAVAVRQGSLLATAFHPELTPDRRFHRLLASLITEPAPAEAPA